MLDAEILRRLGAAAAGRNKLRYVVADRREASADTLRGHFFATEEPTGETLKDRRHHGEVQPGPRRLPHLQQRDDHDLRPRGGAMRGNRDLQLAVRLAVACAVLAIAAADRAPQPDRRGAPDLLPSRLRDRLRRLRPPPDRFRRACSCSASASAWRCWRLLPLLLDLLPGGISTGWWAVSLCLVVLGAARAAALGRRKPARAAFRRPRLSLARAEAGLLALGLLAGVAAVVLIFIPVSAKNAIGYSELWIVPQSGEVASVLDRGRQPRAGGGPLPDRGAHEPERNPLRDHQLRARAGRGTGADGGAAGRGRATGENRRSPSSAKGSRSPTGGSPPGPRSRRDESRRLRSGGRRRHRQLQLRRVPAGGDRERAEPRPTSGCG